MSNKNQSSNLLNLNFGNLKYPLFQQPLNTNDNSIEEQPKLITQQQSIQINKKNQHVHHIQNVSPILSSASTSASTITSTPIPIQNNQSNSLITPVTNPENLFHLMELLTNLKLLSHLKQHDKLTCDNKNDLVEIDSRYYLQGIRRWICGDTRTETINFIEKLVASAEYLSENLILSKNIDDKHNLKILTEDLISSKNGLNNLKITYFDDKLFVSRVENYLEKIKLRIDKNNKSI